MRRSIRAFSRKFPACFYVLIDHLNLEATTG